MGNLNGFGRRDTTCVVTGGSSDPVEDVTQAALRRRAEAAAVNLRGEHS